MKYLLIPFVTLLFGIQVEAQEMDNQKLHKIFTEVSDSIQGENGSWQFVVGEVYMLCLTDQTHNRMRIISPIKEMKEVPNEELTDVLEANFHSALDVRYAISDDLMWAAFIHPLRQLSEDQVIDAISQVYSGVLTYGTIYTSTDLSFPKAKGEKNVGKKY